jgi:hypothetical protein
VPGQYRFTIERRHQHPASLLRGDHGLGLGQRLALRPRALGVLGRNRPACRLEPGRQHRLLGGWHWSTHRLTHRRRSPGQPQGVLGLHGRPQPGDALQREGGTPAVANHRVHFEALPEVDSGRLNVVHRHRDLAQQYLRPDDFPQWTECLTNGQAPFGEPAGGRQATAGTIRL